MVIIRAHKREKIAASCGSRENGSLYTVMFGGGT